MLEPTVTTGAIMTAIIARYLQQQSFYVVYGNKTNEIHRQGQTDIETVQERDERAVVDLVEQWTDRVIPTIKYQQHWCYVGLAEVEERRLTSDDLLHTHKPTAYHY